MFYGFSYIVQRLFGLHHVHPFVVLHWATSTIATTILLVAVPRGLRRIVQAILCVAVP